MTRSMVEKDVVRRGYDELVATYADERAAEGEGVEVLKGLLAELPDDARVLDAGCGQGTAILERISERVTGIGIDLSGGQLRLAAENAPGAALAQADMTRLPFETGVFDAVTAYYSLIHVPEGDHRTVLGEFARVLRPGGRLLLVEGTTEWRGTNPDWLDGGAEMQWYIAGPAATRTHLRTADFGITGEWIVGSSLDEDAEWQLFGAELEP